MKGDLYQKQGNEYRMTPFAMPEKGFCEFIAADKLVWQDVINHSNFPPDKTTCPVPAGEYIVKNWNYDSSQIPKFVTGTFQSKLTLTKGKKSAVVSLFFSRELY